MSSFLWKQLRSYGAIADAHPVTFIGVDARLMRPYVQFVADRLLVALGNVKFYRVSNPFMAIVSVQEQPDFLKNFELDYSTKGVRPMTSGKSRQEQGADAHAL